MVKLGLSEIVLALIPLLLLRAYEFDTSDFHGEKTLNC
jgi:hypothetical protein